MLRILILIFTVFIINQAIGQNFANVEYISTGSLYNFNTIPQPQDCGVVDLNWKIISTPTDSIPHYAKVGTNLRYAGWGQSCFNNEIGNTTFPNENLRIICPTSILFSEQAGYYKYQTKFFIEEEISDVLFEYKYLADDGSSVFLNGVLLCSQNGMGRFDCNELGSNTIIDLNKFNFGPNSSENILEVIVKNVGDRTGLCFNSKLTTVPLCDTCNTFKLLKNEEYWMSGWVNVEQIDDAQVKTYSNSITPDDGANIELEFLVTGTVENMIFYPTGDIINGWQRVVGKFMVPTNASSLILNLNADHSKNTYFDDIRIHPFNASMKSYVYDGETFWLTSELDDNNYATFYEYDNEGGLVRIKKETARGIVTIQETRSSTIKVENTTED